MKRLFAFLLVFALILPIIPANAASTLAPTITSMVLRPDKAGIYFKAKLEGNTDQVAAWGIALSTSQMPNEQNLDTKCLYTQTTDPEKVNSALLTNIFKQANDAATNLKNGEMKIYSCAYAVLTDGSYVFGQGVTYSLQQLMAAIDKKVGTLNDAQKEALNAMYDNYIGITHKWGLANIHDDLALNAIDASHLEVSIEVLEDSSYSGIDLASRMYQHAFTVAIKTRVGDDPVAQLADGTATDELKTMGVTPETLTESVLMTGDLLYVGDKLYIYGAGGLRSLNGTGAPLVDTAAVLATVTDYTLLRPALALVKMNRSDVTAPRDVLTPQQEALIATAEAYWLRGERLQYADTRFTTSGSSYGSEFRWQSTVNTPEDCTLTDWGYTNCAAFTYENYYQTFGYKLPNNMYTTSNLAKYAADNGMEVFVYNRTKGSTQTEEEKQQVMEEFFATLQPGDIICIRREANTGHALLYVGNGEILHSGGSTYVYTGSYGVEKYEASVRRVRVDNYFFNPDISSGGDVFTVATKLQIIRPLDVMTNAITENTANRLENLRNVVAEKISSHVRAQTAEKGEEITFTYAMHNLGDKAVTLTIKETIPSELEHISGGTRSGDTLTWMVTVPAHGRASVSYIAKVKTTVAYGTTIQSTESYVGGVRVKCEPITVNKKLTKTQQDALIAAAQKLLTDGSSLSGLALVNDLYKQATGIESIFGTNDFLTVTEGSQGCFTYHMTYSSKNIYKLNPDGDYANMLAPSLYGGYRLWASEFANDRTRLAKVQDLQIGDILLGRTSSSQAVFMWLGEDIGFISMSTKALDTVAPADRLERLLAYGYYYAIMRPIQGQ